MGDHLRICNRWFSSADLEMIRRLIAEHPDYSRAELSRQVCAMIDWRRPDGRLKDMSCRVAMLRMHRKGMISLPPPQHRSANQRRRPTITSASNPQPPIPAPAGQLGALRFEIVRSRSQSRWWNELIERYHYLRYTPLNGAQMRYLVFSEERLLAAMGFSAAAWALAPRDQFIRWSPAQRKQRLHLVVNNARFLIPPWVQSHNLASRILGRAARMLPQHWAERYGYRPVLLETFVDPRRYRGTCYRAANWIYVGKTKGRGKRDRNNRCILPIKDVFLLPLHHRFREILCEEM